MKAKTRHMVMLAAVVGFIVTLSISLTTHEVAAQTVLRACYVPNSGVVYRIGLPDTPDECKGKKHVEFSWTDAGGADHGALAGLTDDDHPQYLQASDVASPWAGFQSVTAGENYYLSPGTRTISYVVRCPEGKIPINGGYSGRRQIDPDAPVVLEQVEVNHPTPDGWAAAARVTNTSPTEYADFYWNVHANCVNGP